MGPGGRGGAVKAQIAQVKSKAYSGAAWAAQGLTIAAGATLLGTVVGQTVAAVFGFLPQPAKLILMVVAVLWAIGDWVEDGVPNQQALYIGVAAPMLAAGLDGKIAANVLSGSAQVQGFVNQWAGPWIGTTSAIGLAGVFLAAAFVIARHTVR